MYELMIDGTQNSLMNLFAMRKNLATGQFTE